MRTPTAATRTKATPKKIRVKGDTVEPMYALHLMERIGPTAAAKAIGVTPGTLHKARNNKAISRAFEVAAKGIWIADGYGEAVPLPAIPRTPDLGAAVAAPTAEGTLLMLVQVPRERASMLLKTAEMLGATVVVQD